MSQAYHCPPSEFWCFDESTPKGYYFNRGVFLFGRMIDNEMSKAEARARKNRKPKSAERLANAARLGVLQKYLGGDIKRFRDPAIDGKTTIKAETDADSKKDKDTSVVWKI
jgi:hypothetical protein